MTDIFGGDDPSLFFAGRLDGARQVFREYAASNWPDLSGLRSPAALKAKHSLVEAFVGGIIFVAFVDGDDTGWIEYLERQIDDDDDDQSGDGLYGFDW